HPVHAEVAAAGLRVVGDHGWERDERRRVAGPAALDRQEAEVDIVAAQHDLLARALADRLRAGVGDGLELAQPSDLLEQPFWRLHLEHVRDSLRDVVESLDLYRASHVSLVAYSV